MKQVPDRKRLRREYLRRRRRIWSILSALNIFMWLLRAGIVVCLGKAILFPGGSILFVIVAAVITVVLWFMHAFVRPLTRRVKHLLSNVPYVPPVTPNALPADEILVRGSEEPPVAQSEVLLRAAMEVETPKEELLRVSQE